MPHQIIDASPDWQSFNDGGTPFTDALLNVGPTLWSGVSRAMEIKNGIDARKGQELWRAKEFELQTSAQQAQQQRAAQQMEMEKTRLAQQGDLERQKLEEERRHNKATEDYWNEKNDVTREKGGAKGLSEPTRKRIEDTITSRGIKEGAMRRSLALGGKVVPVKGKEAEADKIRAEEYGRFGFDPSGASVGDGAPAPAQVPAPGGGLNIYGNPAQAPAPLWGGGAGQPAPVAQAQVAPAMSPAAKFAATHPAEAAQIRKMTLDPNSGLTMDQKFQLSALMRNEANWPKVLEFVKLSGGLPAGQ